MAYTEIILKFEKRNLVSFKLVSVIYLNPIKFFLEIYLINFIWFFKKYKESDEFVTFGYLSTIFMPEALNEIADLL